MIQDYESYYSYPTQRKASETGVEVWYGFRPGGPEVTDLEDVGKFYRQQFMPQIMVAKGTGTDMQIIYEHHQAQQADNTFLGFDYRPFHWLSFEFPRISPRRELQRVWETTAEQFYHIAASRGVMNGEPCITGTRIPVSIIVSMVGEGHTFEEIAEDYGNISIEEVREAVLFAARLTW